MRSISIRKEKFVFLIVLFFLLSIPLGSNEASAVPAFAKQYEAECTLCHTAFPKLNDFGTKFRINGYRMEGDTGKYIWEQPQTLGFVGSAVYENVDKEMEMDMGMGPVASKSKDSSFDAGSLLIYSAGTLAPRVSYFAHMVAGDDETTLGLYNMSFMDIVADAGLNVKLGVMSVDLPFLSSTRRLTINNYLIQLGAGGGHGGHGGGVYACSACGASFTNSGAEVNGVRDYGEYSIQYAIGAGNDSVHEADDNVGAFYGWAYLNWQGQSLGLMYKHDRTGDNEAERQNADASGISVDLNFAGLNLVGSYNLFTQGQVAGSDLEVTSGAIEAIYPLVENILGVVRYDFNDVQDSDKETTQIVASLIWYLQPNVKVQVEYAQSKYTNASGTDFDSSGVFAAATAGF
ncbi:hypothetical protein MNBD_NITROSPINAE04-656 [hydrothermal vent metagenome]|uniref:Cytochrome c domain-containing protein n=1 Tax=hydrothermal vent metagenome TaxID=652676 RepID=A0A3B1BYX7_9ZZZZ